MVEMLAMVEVLAIKGRQGGLLPPIGSLAAGGVGNCGAVGLALKRSVLMVRRA